MTSAQHVALEKINRFTQLAAKENSSRGARARRRRSQVSIARL